jgi:hypothetical protein
MLRTEIAAFQQPGMGHNKGPSFAPVADEELNDVDALIALLKDQGPTPPADPKPLIEQAEKTVRLAERIRNALLGLVATICLHPITRLHRN